LKDERPGGSTPSQYGLPEGATDLQDLIEYRDMNFALGNIFKACYRRGTCSHSDELRDMRKVLWFAEREINRLEQKDFETKMREHLVNTAMAKAEAQANPNWAADPQTVAELEKMLEGQEYDPSVMRGID